jgi:two-component system nitrate/nitrite response regulator NarL
MRKTTSISTILIGKSALIREGIAGLLRAANYRVAASVSNTDDLASDKLQSQPGLYLVVHTGDDFDVALRQIERLRSDHPQARIAIVADHYRRDELASAFQAGVNGYFFDLTACDVFIKSIELVMMGETIFPPVFLPFALDPKDGNAGKTVVHDGGERAILFASDDTTAPQLSPRENSILHCLVDGFSNKSIARKIDIAEATVKVHVKAILRKIRVQNRTQAAIWGMNNGYLARPTNGAGLSSTVDAGRRLPSSGKMVSEIMQAEASKPAAAIASQVNHVALPHIDGLLPKGIERRANGAMPLTK